MLAALSGCNSSGTGSSSAAPTTTWVSRAYLASSFTADLAAETTANMNYVTALNAATGDITKQEQKLTLDNNTIQKIGFGQDCNAADASTYASCVSQDQTASYARSDAAAVEALIQSDFQHYASSASAYQSALGAFTGQMLGLPWPSSYNKDVNATVTTARAFRRDVALQEAVLSSTPHASVSTVNNRALVDGGKFIAAIRALRGALTNGGK